MSHYKVTVMHNGETVQVYPQGRERNDTSLDEACKRIGMMVVADNITSVTVYRGGEVYRQCLVSTVKSEAGQ